MKEEYRKIENLLHDVKAKINAHLKFKEKYNKQLAFDFSLFQFFSIGENKISQVLAFFLDVNQNHGQGDIFLREFVKRFYKNEIGIKQLANICEKLTSNGRRIDIYIQLQELTIAIENKIWADDQNNQLRDYSKFLENESQGNYLLLYLNPYGLDPQTKSISKKLKESLINQNKLKIIGYEQDIIPLIGNWIAICDAENVSHFLKEFKKYLEIKFLGKNTLNMSKELREIIFSNEGEVQQLVNEYKKIENEIVVKLNSVGKELDKITPELKPEIEKSKGGLFNWHGSRIYKYSLSKNGNKIWIQFVKNEIYLYSNYYLENGTDEVFKEILAELRINNNIKINHKLSKAELVDIFLEQVRIVENSFEIYDDKIKEKPESNK